MSTQVPVIFTAHSVPQRTIAEGDPYEAQTKETAALVAREVGLAPEDWKFAFQSQGMSGGAWLGPTVENTILELKEKGHRGVFVQPIGFLCDHVEVLYDIDIGFKQFAEKEGMQLWRAESLNDSPLADGGIGRFGAIAHREYAEVCDQAAADERSPGARVEADMLDATSKTRMKRIAIVGGGISGLAAAFALEERRRAGESLEYVVYESGPRFGGVLVTEQVDGCLVEAGPDSFLTEKPWAADLCRRLGLEDQLIGSNDSDRKTYILVKGKLSPMPDGLMFMVPTRLAPALLSPLFSAATKLRMVREWRFPPRRSECDESVAALVERHYGAEMVERLADPLLSGVYGGEASQLSVRAVLPRFARDGIEVRQPGPRHAGGPQEHENSARPAAPMFTSLKDGMQQLAEALVASLPADALRANSPVQAVQRQDRGWVVSAGYASDQFDAVIVATPATAARLCSR